MQDLIQKTDNGRLYEWIKQRLGTGSGEKQSKASAEEAAQAAAQSASGKADNPR
jgi:hypothetical protein